MEQERYDLIKDDEDFVYWFYSEGPKGCIKKAVRFQHDPQYGKNFFNLAFGDWEEPAKRINDKVVSNNGDHLKVLYTVTEIVLHFFNLLPKAILQIQGSTPSRTRLYQVGIASFWNDISQEFDIMGEVGRDWEPFRKGVNYKRVLIFKKIK
jgi:hypothetical protein